MIDTVLLKKTIKESGLKKEYIAEQLGISLSSFSNKINGRYPFKIPEMVRMEKVLNLDESTIKEIFFKK